MDFTAFTLASARNHFGIMKLLLEAGADTEFVDKMVRNQRVLDRQIKIQLDNQGFMFFFFLWRDWFYSLCIAPISSFLSSLFPFAWQDSFTALIRASATNKVDSVKLLLEAGANKDTSNEVRVAHAFVYCWLTTWTQVAANSSLVVFFFLIRNFLGLLIAFS